MINDMLGKVKHKDITEEQANAVRTVLEVDSDYGQVPDWWSDFHDWCDENNIIIGDDI